MYPILHHTPASVNTTANVRKLLKERKPLRTENAVKNLFNWKLLPKLANF